MKKYWRIFLIVEIQIDEFESGLVFKEADDIWYTHFTAAKNQMAMYIETTTDEDCIYVINETYGKEKK